MKLVHTADTAIASLNPVVEEDWVHETGMRVVPENQIEEDALRQIWKARALKEWSLEGREIPFKKAVFDERISRFTQDGFACGSVTLWTKFDPLKFIKGEADPMPISMNVRITVFWLWENNQIKAYWSIAKSDNEYLVNNQTNSAEFPIVFR